MVKWILFFTMLAYAEDIDAEILKDLEFFKNMDVAEQMDIVDTSEGDMSRAIDTKVSDEESAYEKN